jgi:hypothetical protein
MRLVKHMKLKMWLYPRLGIHRAMWRRVRDADGYLTAISGKCLGCTTRREVYLEGRCYITPKDATLLLREFCIAHSLDRRRAGTA